MNLKLLFIPFFLHSLSALTQNFEWVSTVNGPNTVSGKAIIMDTVNGAIYTAGSFFGTADFDSGSGTNSLTANSSDAYLLKLDASGQFQWVEQIGGPNSEQVIALQIATTNDILLLSRTIGGPLLLSTFSTTGNLSATYQTEGTGSISPKGFTLDNQDNIYIVGSFSDTIDFDGGPGVSEAIATGLSSGFLLKLDPNNNFVWVKTFNGIHITSLNAIDSDTTNMLYACGHFSADFDADPGPGTTTLSAISQTDAFVIKLDSSGQLIWTAQTGGFQTCENNVIVVSPQGNSYISGNFTGEVDTDPSSADYLIDSNGEYDFYIQSLDVSGNFLWTAHFGGSDHDGSNALSLDNNNNVYATGYVHNTVDFDPSSGTLELSTNTPGSTFILKLGQDGTLKWAKNINSVIGFNIGHGISAPLEDQVFISGNYVDSTDFDPNNGTVLIGYEGVNDTYILKLSSIGANLNPHTAMFESLTIYPNPTEGSFYTNMEGDHMMIEVYTMDGKLIHTAESIQGQPIILDKTQAGTYLVKVYHENVFIGNKRLMIK